MACASTAAIFVRSLEAFVRNPILIVPGFLAGGLAGFAAILVEPGNAASADAQLESDVVTRSLALVVQVIASVLSIAFTTGMAHAVWEGRRASLAQGRRAFAREGGRLIVALGALFALGFVAAALAPYTAWLSLALYAYLCLYVPAAVIVGDRPGLVAVAQSAHIACSHPFPTIAIVGVVFGIAYVAGVGALYVSRTPYVGPMLAALVLQCVVVYATLLIVGAYLRAQPQEHAA